MVSIVAPITNTKHRGFAWLSLLKLLNRRLFFRGLAAYAKNATCIQNLLVKAATAGSVYGTLALLFGGFYVNWWQLPGVVLRVAYTVVMTLCEYIARGGKPLFQEWTLAFELTRAVMRALMSTYGHDMLHVKCARHLRVQSEVVGTALGVVMTRLCATTTESFRYNGLEHMWIRSASSTSSSSSTARRVVVLYFHGGGFAALSPRMYIPFGSEMQSRIQAKLTAMVRYPNQEQKPAIQVELLLANYRKIPEHPYPIPNQDALAMYKYLLHTQELSPHQIIIAGDSAGGGLTLSTMLQVRETTPHLLPLAGILSSPFVDLEVIGDERKAPHCVLADKPCQAVQQAYHPREGHPSTWGDASPVHCNLSGLPPVYIQAAELDYILPHATKLMEKALTDGVENWQMDIFPNVPHTFTNFLPILVPSAEQGLDRMAQYAADHFAAAARNMPKYA